MSAESPWEFEKSLDIGFAKLVHTSAAIIEARFVFCFSRQEKGFLKNPIKVETVSMMKSFVFQLRNTIRKILKSARQAHRSGISGK